MKPLQSKPSGVTPAQAYGVSRNGREVSTAASNTFSVDWDGRLAVVFTAAGVFQPFVEEVAVVETFFLLITGFYVGLAFATPFFAETTSF
jgi:hypothetical protein